jgi:hypothetical protein
MCVSFPPDWPPPDMPHLLVYVLWCLVPALVLLPLRLLDRDPLNEISQEQDPCDGVPGKRDDGIALAA